jgi:polyisoprenoid-binding protein YceI
MKFLLSFLVLLSINFAVTAQKKITPVDVTSNVGFTIKNFGLTVDGSLSGLKGTIIIDEKKQRVSSIDVTVDVNSIDTKNDRRDKHLRTDDYFDAEKFPTMLIKSSSIVSTKTVGSFILNATLTIKDVSKSISFPITVVRSSNGYILSGNFEIDRLDYSVGKSSMVLANLVKVNLKVLAN